MDEASVFFIVGVIGTTAIGVTLASWYVTRIRMNARPAALPPRTDGEKRCWTVDVPLQRPDDRAPFGELTSVTNGRRRYEGDTTYKTRFFVNQQRCIDIATQIQKLNETCLMRSPSSFYSHLGNPKCCRQRKAVPNDYLLEKITVLENKLFTIENLLKNETHSSNDEIMLVLNETRQSVMTLVNGNTFSENKRDHDLTEIKLRISILEDELKKKLQMNVYFDRMANLILLFEKKLEAELQTGERTETSSTKNTPQQQPPAPPPTPPPPTPPTPPPSPPDPPVLRQRSTTAALEQRQQRNYNRIKISVEDLRKVKLKPLHHRQ